MSQTNRGTRKGSFWREKQEFNIFVSGSLLETVCRQALDEARCGNWDSESWKRIVRLEILESVFMFSPQYI